MRDRNAEELQWDWIDVLLVGLICVGAGTVVVAFGYAAEWLVNALGVW